MKSLVRILSLIIALVLVCSTLAFAVVRDPSFYENAAQQSMDAVDNATSSTDKVFYLVSAMYNYCFTKGVGRAAKLLDQIDEVAQSDADNLSANSQLISIMTQGAGDKLFDKHKYADAEKMYRAAIKYYENYDAKSDDIDYCKDQLVKCEKGALVDKILIASGVVLVAIVIIVIRVVAKRKSTPKFMRNM